MSAGRTLAERQAARQRIRDYGADRAERTAMTLRCQALQHDMDHPNHRLCRGESHGNSGCLCRCHDNPGVTVTAIESEATA